MDGTRFLFDSEPLGILDHSNKMDVLRIFPLNIALIHLIGMDFGVCARQGEHQSNIWP
jgi:hypothetical protein